MNVDLHSSEEIDDDEEDLSALDTLEFAGVLESGEFEAVITACPRGPLHDEDLAFAPAFGDASGASPETAVALLPDTQLEMGVLDASAVGGSGVDAMQLYEVLRTMCTQRFLAVATQMTTRSGRVVVSSITSAERRQRLSDFSSSSISALAHLNLEDQYLLAKVDDLSVWVLAVDEVRVFSALLPSPPVSSELLSVSLGVLGDLPRRSEGP